LKLAVALVLALASSAALVTIAEVEQLDLRALRAMIVTTKDRAELFADSAEDIAKYCAGDDDHGGLTARERAKMRDAGYTVTRVLE